MIDLSHIVTGFGSAVVAFLGASFTREARFNHRLDQELSDLRKEVALCQAERHEFAVVKVGMKMMMPRVRERLADDPVIMAVAVAFERLPQPDESLLDLLKQLPVKSKSGEIQDDPHPPMVDRSLYE